MPIPDNFTIQIDRSGFDLTPWCISYSHSCDFFGVAADSFSCSVFHKDIQMLRRATKPMLQILFTVNGAQQFRGQIDTQTIDDEGVIHLGCSDYLANSVDCSVGKNITLQGGDTLKTAILKVMQSQGIKNVVSGWNTVRNHMAGANIFSGAPAIDFASRKLSENVPVEIDDSCWETVAKLCKLHRCLPKAGLNGDTIHLVSPEIRSAAAFTLFRQLKNPANNFRTNGGVVRDYSKMPTVFIATGTAGKSSENQQGTFKQINPFTETLKDIPEVQDIARDEDRPQIFEGRFDYKPGHAPGGVIYREMRIHANTKKELKQAHNQSELESLANVTLSDVIKDTLRIDFETDGHSQNGVNWCADALTSVTDGIGGVFEPMWIAGRTFDFDGNDQTTSGTVYRPASLVL